MDYFDLDSQDFDLIEQKTIRITGPMPIIQRLEAYAYEHFGNLVTIDGNADIPIDSILHSLKLLPNSSPEISLSKVFDSSKVDDEPELQLLKNAPENPVTIVEFNGESKPELQLFKNVPENPVTIVEYNGES